MQCVEVRIKYHFSIKETTNKSLPRPSHLGHPLSPVNEILTKLVSQGVTEHGVQEWGVSCWQPPVSDSCQYFVVQDGASLELIFKTNIIGLAPFICTFTLSSSVLLLARPAGWNIDWQIISLKDKKYQALKYAFYGHNLLINSIGPLYFEIIDECFQ